MTAGWYQFLWSSFPVPSKVTAVKSMKVPIEGEVILDYFMEDVINV